MSNIADQKKYNIHTIQNIGSISKTLIGVALMKLVDQGKLNLDDPINDHLPFAVVHLKFPKTPITILDLATHSSGIKDRPSNYDFKSYYLNSDLQKTEVLNKGFSMEERIFLKKIKKNNRIPLGVFLERALDKNGKWYSDKNFYDFEPGHQYEYTNLGATLGAFIVEQASGMSYESFTEKEILAPLNMKSTGWFYKTWTWTAFQRVMLEKN